MLLLNYAGVRIELNIPYPPIEGGGRYFYLPARWSNSCLIFVECFKELLFRDLYRVHIAR